MNKNKKGGTFAENVNKAGSPPMQDISAMGSPLFTPLQANPEDTFQTAPEDDWTILQAVFHSLESGATFVAVTHIFCLVSYIN